MKQIRAIVLILSSVFIVISNAYSQSLTISGGDGYGVIICAKGAVYAWGDNPNNVLGLKTSGSATQLKPALVNLPEGLTMQQVIAGSGATTTALSCNNVVYAWGVNEKGECGQGTTSAKTAPITKASPVLKGQTEGYDENGNLGGLYLGNVKFVAAATSSSYAILNDGRCVSWGSNSDGQLGAGLTGATALTPVFVVDQNNKPLKNVIHVAGGDYTAYFLVDDGNGYGTVYSCGAWIGRTGNARVAMPVKKADGTNLSGISIMAAGDVHGLAVEGATGYVYGWGNDGWGCLVGCATGGARCDSQTAAYQVISGEYKAVSGEDYLTDVKEVVGGRGYSAAVTKEGYVLYWGNNESENGVGGWAPNGSTAGDFCSTGPQFAVYCNASGLPPAATPSNAIKDAVHLARGDCFGFMVNEANKYYAWGKNDRGQLGLNLAVTQNRHCMQEIKDIPCVLPDPMPEVFLVPKMEKCFGVPFELYCNFTPPIGRESVYKFSWYYSTNATGPFTQLTPIADYNKNTIEVDNEGYYKVVVEYIGLEAPCNTVDKVEAQTWLVDKVMPVDTLIIQSCVEVPLSPAATDNICFEFISKYANDALKPLPSSFDVYQKATGGTAITTVDIEQGGNGKGAFCVKGSEIDKVEKVGNDTLYSIWIEDKTKEQGALAPAGKYTQSGTTDGVWNGANATKILVVGDIELGSLKVAFSNRDNNNPVNFTVTAGIYQANGNSVGTRVGTLATQAVSLAPSAATVATLDFGDRLITGNSMRGTEYFIVINLSGGNYNINQYTFNPNADNLDGATVMRLDGGTVDGTNPGNVNGSKTTNLFYDLQFSKLSAYDCGRIKLTSKYYCPPCEKPGTVTITSDDTDNTLCPDGSLKLTSNNQANDTDFTFAWYKGTEDALPTTLPGGTVGEAAPEYTVSYADLDGAVGDKTTFTLLVRDAANPDAKACFVTKEIEILKAETPEYKLSVGDPVCAGETPKGAFVEFTKGVAPFEYKFTIAGATPAKSGTGAAVNKEYLLGTAEGVYKLTSLEDKYCAASTLTDNVEVVINPLPEKPITTELIFLKKAGASESIADAATAVDEDHELYWYAAETGGTGTTTAPSHDISTEGTFYYWVSQKNTKTGCESERAMVTIVVNNCPIPAPKAAETEITICNYNATPTLNVSIGDGWDGNPTASRPTTGITTSTFNLYDAAGTFITSNTTGVFSVTIDKTVEKQHVFTVREEIDFDFPTTSAWDDCEGPATKIIIDVKKPADITITPAGEEVCAGTQNPLFTANGKATGATIEWYTSNPIINETNDGSSALAKTDTYRPTTPTTTPPTIGTQTIYAVQRTTDNCLSAAASQTWKIKAIPAKPAVTNAENCFNTTPNNPVKATGTAIKWYATATSTTALTDADAIDEEYISTETDEGVYTYYATQTVDGCESTERGAAKFTIVALPKTPTVTISDKEICEYDSDPTFTISNQESGSTVNWYKADKTTLVGSGATHNVDRDNGTTYYATQTTACVSEFSAPITFTIHPKPANPIVVSQVMCANEDIPYLGTDGINDKWFRTADASDGVFNTGKSYRPTATEIGTSDEITFYVRRTENECQSDVIPVSLKIIPTPTVEIQGGNKAICLNQEIDVTAHNFTPAYSSTSTLRWTLIDENSSRKPLNETALNTVTLNSTNIVAEGDYTIEVVYNHNYEGKVCTSMPAQVIYTVYPLPNKPIVQDQVRCQSENMEALHAFGSSLITWTSLDGKLPLWIGASYNFAQIGLPSVAVGQYKFELHDIDALTQCESERVQMTFEVAPKAETKIVGETEHCVGTKSSAYTLEQVPQRPSTYEWTISGDRKLYNNDNSTALRYVDWNYSGVDSIWVKETTWAGCEGRDSIAVRVADLPEALFFAERAPNGIETSLQFTNQSTQEPIVFTNEFGNEEREEIPYTMFWNFGKIDLPPFMENYIDTIVEYEQRNIPLVVNDFKYGWARPTLTLENSYGCKSTYATEVFVDITTGFYIPSAFAPSNAAAAVRIFKPIAFNLEYCKVWIYDTWGNLLWYGDRVENGMFVDEWNGTYNGELLPAGTYIWHIDAKFLNGKKWKGTRHRTSGNPKVRGSVVLIR